MNFGVNKFLKNTKDASLSTIYTVRELTDGIKRVFDAQFPFVWVKGEVSNLSRPGSGHIYFSLKDNDALLNCVWFKGNQREKDGFDPLTGEVFEDGPRPSLAETLANGQQILCAGNLSVYAQRGSYQLTVSLVQDDGRGALYAAFEALKKKLMAKGYFAPERKRELLYDPQRVAVITAPTGAAIHDFLRIAHNRGTGGHIRIYPSLMQGEGAAEGMCEALKLIAKQGWAEVIVLIRGGGSIEDLWAFNDETLAEAIFNSPIPVLAGIGHEPDVCLADMTADVRAATPSHAAQLLWPEREELMQYVDGLEMALNDAINDKIHDASQLLQMRERALQWLSPLNIWQRQADKLENFQLRLGHCVQNLLEKNQIKLENLNSALPMALNRYEDRLSNTLEGYSLRLMAQNPLAPLERGYALLRDGDGHVLTSIAQIDVGQNVHMSVLDGEISAIVHDKSAKTR